MPESSQPIEELLAHEMREQQGWKIWKMVEQTECAAQGQHCGPRWRFASALSDGSRFRYIAV
jgi:hypothetical protein